MHASEKEAYASWYQKNRERILTQLKEKQKTLTREEKDKRNALARKASKKPERAAKRRAAAKKYRAANKEALIAKDREYKRKNKDKVKIWSKSSGTKRRGTLRKWLQNYKKQLRCGRCGFSNPAALQFHHICPELKKFNIAFAVVANKLSLDRIIDEIEKCEVLCANCHMIEHYGEEESHDE